MKKVLMTMIAFVFAFALTSCNVDSHKRVFDKVQIGYEVGDSIDHVTQDITLPTTTIVKGATLEWVSSNPEVISNTGVVTRPVDADVEVTLTLKVTINEVVKEKEYILTVIALEEEVNTYEVTFDSNGGSTVEAVTLEEGSKVTKPADPTKDGFNFVGWFKDSELNTAWDFDVDTVTSDVTLYAKWEEVPTPTFVVTFESNGGSTVESVTVEEGSTVTKPADPTKDGFNFVGWFKDSELNTAWDFDVDTVTSNVTLYAKWEEVPTPTYVVTFESNGGSTVEAVTLEEGSTVTKPADPTKEGFNFVGWFKDSELNTAWDFDVDTVTSNVTLYAKWEEVPTPTYVVTFEPNGGSTVEAVTVEEGSTVTKPADPTKEGFNFVGWFKDSELNTAWDFDVDTVTSNVTLYAKWEETVAEPIKLPAPIHGIGHQPRPVAHIAFGPYEFDEGADGGFTGFGIIFNNLTTGEVFTLRKAHAYKAGFATYYTEAELALAGIVLTPGDYKLEYFAMGNGVTTTDSDVSMHSVTFRINNVFEVTFVANGGSEVAPVSVEEGAKVTKPADPTRVDFNFKGWYKDADLTIPWNFELDTVTSNVTLYAKWEEVSNPVTTFEVTFESNGGSAVASITVDEGTKLVKPVDPTKDGFSFMGWFKDSELNTPWDFDVDTVTSDITLYAKWEESQVELIQLPAPIHGIGHQPRPVAHIAFGPYEFEEGANGGFTGFGIKFNNLTTGEVFTVRIPHTYKAGFATYYTEAELAKSGIVLTPGNYKLEYFAMGNGVTTKDSNVSIHSVSFTIEKPLLDTPVLTLDNESKLLSWQAVPNATSYEVYINGVLQAGNTSPFDLSSLTEPGLYKIKVVAKADTHNPSDASVDYVIAGEAPQLSAPTNFALDGFLLTWDEVANAMGYTVTIGNVTKQSMTNSFDLAQFDIGDQTVTVKVVALGNIIDYSDSDEATFTATLPTLLPRLNAMTAGDFVSTYILNGVDGGHRKLEIYKHHPVYNQAGWTGMIRIGIKVNGQMIYHDFNFSMVNMQMIHTPGSTTSFFGANLPQTATVEIHFILVGDNVTARDSNPLILTMNWSRS